MEKKKMEDKPSQGKRSEEKLRMGFFACQ